MTSTFVLTPRLIWRAIWLFILPNLAIFALNAITEPQPVLFWLGAINSSLSLGVSAAFLPAIFRIFTVDRPLEKGDWLAFGIWISWTANAMRFVHALIWRWEGMPVWMLNTDYTVYFSCMTTVGVVSHLIAPGAIGDRIPPRRWIIIGLIAAAGVLCMIVLGYVLRTRVITDIGRWVG